MDDHGNEPADYKALALSYAYTALVRALNQSGHLEMDLLFSNLAGARMQLERIGETDSATLLGSLAESLQGI